MNVIKQRIRLFATVSSLGLLTSLFILLESVMMHRIKASPFFLPAMLLTVFTIWLLIKEYGKYKAAKLIVDNKIMHIQVAQVEDITGKSKNTAEIGNMEVFISCFGVLLDSKVIEFNIDAIKLKGVEIGHEFICLYYGTDKVIRKIRILHGNIGTQELQGYIDRFCYETGVVPVAIDF